MQRAHLAMILWKAAKLKKNTSYRHHRARVTLKNGIPTPTYSVSTPAPPELLNVLSCSCKAKGRAFSSIACSCHKTQLSCTAYCNCEGLEGCFNPFLIKNNALNSEMDNKDNSDE